MTIKNAVYGGLGFFLLIIVVLFIFKGQQGPQIKDTASDLFPAPTKKIQPAIPSSSVLKPQVAEQPLTPSFSSLFEESLLKPVFLEPVLEIKELIKPVKKEAVFSLLPPESPSLNSSLDEGLIAGANEIQQKKSLSLVVLTLEQEKEIFAKLYPDYFTNGLMDIQNVFIEQGWLGGNYQKIKNFDTEEKILSFVNTGIDVFERQGWYTKEEAEKFRKGANEIWKDLMEKEKLEFQQQLIKSEFFKKIFASKIHHLARLVSQKFFKIFPKIYAQSVFNNSSNGDGPGECWKSGNPLLPVGINLISLCCDCGLGFGKKPPFILHCGADGGACAIQLGCLNKLARFKGFSAIWDSESGICGVG